MGQHKMRNTGGLSETGYLGRGAVLWPGADPVRDLLRVSCLVNHNLDIRACFEKQVRLVIVTGNNHFAWFSGNLGVVVAMGQAAIFQNHIVALLQSAPGWAGLNTVSFKFVTQQLAFEVLFSEHKRPAGYAMGEGNCRNRQRFVLPVKAFCLGINKSYFKTEA